MKATDGRSLSEKILFDPSSTRGVAGYCTFDVRQFPDGDREISGLQIVSMGTVDYVCCTTRRYYLVLEVPWSRLDLEYEGEGEGSGCVVADHPEPSIIRAKPERPAVPKTRRSALRFDANCVISRQGVPAARWPMILPLKRALACRVMASRSILPASCIAVVALMRSVASGAAVAAEAATTCTMCSSAAPSRAAPSLQAIWRT